MILEDILHSLASLPLATPTFSCQTLMYLSTQLPRILVKWKQDVEEDSTHAGVWGQDIEYGCNVSTKAQVGCHCCMSLSHISVHMQFQIKVVEGVNALIEQTPNEEEKSGQSLK